MNEDVILRLKNIRKTYPGVVALNNVSFELKKGEVHAIMGENGAGKSTLIKTIAGAISPDCGSIEVDGKEHASMTPIVARELGIEVVYQEFNLMPSLSVAENIFMTELHKGRFLVSQKEFIRRTEELFGSLGIEIDPKAKVKDITNAYKQLVEIAKAISKPTTRILILDEPTAPLTVNEVDILFRVIGDLKKKGISIIYISHRMNEIYQIADRVTVMRDGTYISTSDINQIDRQTLIRLMVGRDINDEVYPAPEEKHKIGDVVLKCNNLCGDGLHNISFDIRKGEILGFAGLVGVGRTETLRMVYGADLLYSGEIFLEGKKTTIRSPQEALDKGIALVPEDRKIQGLLLKQTIKENIVVSVEKRLSKMTVINRRAEIEMAEKYCKLLNIKTPSIHQLAKNLSGGNQQKVALAKCLATGAKVLIMDEPTRGIDVGAKQEIYKLMRQLTAEGMAIIMISSEMEELLGMSDRVVIMCEGRVSGVLDKEDFDQKRILTMASGL